MPVQGRRNRNQAPIKSNNTGQMVNQNQGANPRGRGQPRAQKRTMKGGGKKAAKKGGKRTVGKYLAGDITYQSQLSDLKRNWQNYRNEYRGNVEDVKESFTDTVKRMQQQRGLDLEAMREDFAARGILASTPFAKSYSNYNDLFASQKNQLREDRTEQLEDLQTNRGLFKEEIRSTRRNARLDAIRRRASQLGLTGRI